MKLLAIDGNSIMNRAFHGIKALSNKKGTFTNALTGFMNIYLKTARDISPDCCAVAFDLKEPTFRHKASAAYKANRHGMPDELAMQMPLIKNILRDMGISVIECPGFEADDIPLMVEAIPLSSESIMLIITKIEDPEELDTRFSRFSPAPARATQLRVHRCPRSSSAVKPCLAPSCPPVPRAPPSPPL